MTELDNSRYALGIKERELAELSSDLNAVTRDNQNLTAELEKSIGERDYRGDQLNNLKIEEKRCKQELRAVEMERDDVLQNYRKVCVEVERLENTCQVLFLLYF